jgi:hypothetical protein
MQLLCYGLDDVLVLGGSKPVVIAPCYPWLPGTAGQPDVPSSPKLGKQAGANLSLI